MKAPDKIYLLSPKEGQIGNIAFEEPILAENFGEQRNIAYIRKDALLEWLRKEYETISWYYEKMQHVTGCVGNTDSSGKAEAYKKVIDKIESL